MIIRTTSSIKLEVEDETIAILVRGLVLLATMVDDALVCP